MSWSDVNFGYDSAQVSSMYQSRLDEAAAALQATSGSRLVVSGHTDSRGNPEYNRKLSMRRAEATRAALVDAGVPADRIEIQGFGEDSLLMPDADSSANQAANRRTDIELVQ